MQIEFCRRRETNDDTKRDPPNAGRQKDSLEFELWLREDARTHPMLYYSSTVVPVVRTPRTLSNCYRYWYLVVLVVFMFVVLDFGRKEGNI